MLKLGSIFGKENRRIRFLNKKRKKKKVKQQEEKKKVDKQTEEKQKEILLQPIVNKIQEEKKEEKDIQLVDLVIDLEPNISKKKSVSSKSIKPTSVPLEEPEKIVKTPKRKKEKKIESPIVKLEKEEKIEKQVEESKKIILKTGPANKVLQDLNKKQEEEKLLEVKILHILDKNIKNKKQELKKLDHSLYTLGKKLDTLDQKEELDDSKKEIKVLLEKIEKLNQEIETLKKMTTSPFSLLDIPSNLQKAFDDYKEVQKQEKVLASSLKKNVEYQPILMTLLEIEEREKQLLSTIEEKESKLQENQTQLDFLNKDEASLEKEFTEFSKMMKKFKEQLDSVSKKINSNSLEIYERVDIIHKAVEHSILELLLLMAAFHQSLKGRNPAIDAVVGMLALKEIMRITTPIKKEVHRKEFSYQDFEKEVSLCLQDVDYLKRMLENNLDQVGSLRYLYEKNYQEYSHLPNYQHSLDKIISLEKEMTIHLEQVKKMEEETKKQQEINQTKVLQYDQIKDNSTFT